ncbi:MAG: SAM-dependent methyltransferase [Gammaproteobacteria bacterium]|nr:SAM-dependent methyltransferase [Gammaproteobacteria bacterium]
MTAKVHRRSGPSDWIKKKLDSFGRPVRYAVDIASGAGRHSFLLSDIASDVTAVDRNLELSNFFRDTHVHFLCIDLERPTWPMEGDLYDIVLVSNYLYRPHLIDIIELVSPGGFLVYETFGNGNERFGKPSNPNFLLKPGELRRSVGDDFVIIEDFFGEVEEPQHAVKSRFFARRAENPIE